MAKKTESTADVLKKKVNEIAEQVEAIRQKSMEKAGQMFVPYFKTEIFDKIPSLESFGWLQYAYFYCDGPECEFETHFDTRLFINEEELDSDLLEDWDGSLRNTKKQLKENPQDPAKQYCTNEHYQSRINDLEKYKKEAEEGLKEFGLTRKDITLIQKACKRISDEVYETAFGPDQMVTFYRDGTFENKSYGDHE